MTIYKFTSYSDASFDVRPIEVEERSKSYVTSDRFHINKSSINCLNKSTLLDEMYSTDNDPAVFLTAVIEKNKKHIEQLEKELNKTKATLEKWQNMLENNSSVK